MKNVEQILKELVAEEAADIFIITGRPISYKVNQRLRAYSDEVYFPDQTKELILQIYTLAGRDPNVLFQNGDDDFSFAVKGISRFRINAYKSRGSFAAVIRVITFNSLDPKALNIPQSILDLADRQHGLVLVTGPSYSGKTTTLSCILNEINTRKESHIITLEDPIEYLHSHKKSIISQREVALDTKNYPTALRAALRQSPDVILIGELRDMETISIALTSAETGHYVFSALHALGSANAIDRLVDNFPASQQEQVRMQLSMVLQTVICQQLIPTIDGSVVPVFEIMHCNNAIRNLIRGGRTHQINSFIQSLSSEGMVSMDNSIAELYKNGVITKQEAFLHSLIPDYLKRQIGDL